MPDATLYERPVLIVDLDGTLLSINSFRHWVLFLLRGHFPGIGRLARVRLAATTASLLLARRAHLLGHESFKRALQRLWQRATAGDRGAAERLFLDELDGFVRPSLRPLLAAISAGEHDAILATAAASDYAESFGIRLGFRHVLATKRQRERGELSNDGERKRVAVVAHLARQGWNNRPLILLTDHEDDLPLVQLCSTIYWFGPRVPHASDCPEDSVIFPGEAITRLIVHDRSRV